MNLSIKDVFITLGVYFNIGWACFWIFLIYLGFKFPETVGKFALEVFQGGDGGGQHEDGSRFLMFVGGATAFWTFTSTVLFGVGLDIPNLWAILAIESGMFLGLIGLKKFS